MQFLARRAWGALLLVALVACPTTMVEAATRTHRSRTSSSTLRAKKSKRRGTRHASRRRGRRVRAPQGGVYARNAIVMDPSTEQVLYEKNSARTVPIASLTKLMTAMVFLEQKPDLRREVVVTRAELSGGGHTQLRNNEQVALYDLLHMSLMNSDNVATRVLARESGLSRDEFVGRMNDRARDLGLFQTRYVEPTGLDERNVSTAADIARLLHASARQYLIREITTTPSYVFTSASNRPHTIVNTNRLLRSGRYEVNCGKTGFISESGYCFATWIRNKGRDLIAVVLGAPTAATRFADVVRLVQRTETLAAAESRN